MLVDFRKMNQSKITKKSPFANARGCVLDKASGARVLSTIDPAVGRLQPVYSSNENMVGGGGEGYE